MSEMNKANPETRTIRVPALARVEGEGALDLAMCDGRIEHVRLEIYEPPRFFEAFLRQRDFREVPDITAPHLRDLSGGLPDERLPRAGEGDGSE